MEPEHEEHEEEYRGHRIELRTGVQTGGAAALHAPDAGREAKPELRIDGKKMDYGQFPDGRYFLNEYAYDWTDDLKELARKFVDYRIRAEESRRERQSGGGE